MEIADHAHEAPGTRDGARGDGLGDRLSRGCDAAVLEDLYDAYGASCYRLACRMVSEPDLASTLVRDVYLAVWTGTAVFEPTQGSVQTWLLGLTHRRAVVALRRERRLRSAASDEALAVLPQLRSTECHVLELAYFGGHTQSEIAILTGATLGTIRTLTLQALHELRRNHDPRESSKS